MELNENEVVAKFATTNLCLCIKSQLVQKFHRFRRAIICANFAYTKDSGCREGFTQTNEITPLQSEHDGESSGKPHQQE